jgi:tRNA1Val (adenine37-N6)-methyltransferase
VGVDLVSVESAAAGSARIADDLTDDAVFGGRVRVAQSRSGYRFSIDAILLAWRVVRGAPGSGLEVGSGSGVVSLAVMHTLPGYRGVCVEVQPRLAALTAYNAARNGFSSRLEVVNGDIRDATLRAERGRSEVVFMNPPYHSPARGQVNPDRERAAARHQVHGDIGARVAACADLVDDGGRLEVVYPAARFDELRGALEAVGLARVDVRWVHSDAVSGAKLCLVTAARGSRPEVLTEPPLVLFALPDRYTDEVAAMLAGGV